MLRVVTGIAPIVITIRSDHNVTDPVSVNVSDQTHRVAESIFFLERVGAVHRQWVLHHRSQTLRNKQHSD